MEQKVNEEKRNKFIEYAGKRVNNVLHDIQILEPMARSNSYDFTKQDVEEMFDAIEETLKEAREEYNKKFEEKEKSVKKTFSFGSSKKSTNVVEEISGVESTENAENLQSNIDGVNIENKDDIINTQLFETIDDSFKTNV